LHGSATLIAAGKGTTLGRGSIALAPHATEFVIETQAEDLVIFQASLPVHARGAA
jgi:hypothetical protein